MWVANTGAVMTTTQTVATGPIVWLGVSQTLIAVDPIRTPIFIFVSSTVGGSAATTLLMTIWTGASLAGAGLTQFAVPAGKRLVLNAIHAVWNSSAVTGGTIQVLVNAATASASMTSANQATIGRPLMLQGVVSAGITGGSIIGLNAEVSAATTIGLFQNASTACVIGNVMIHGYLF
jgi:hypothetical protein